MGIPLYTCTHLNHAFYGGEPTLRISVSGEPQNLFVNLQIILEYYIIYLGLASNFVLFSGDVSFCLSMVNCKLYN